MNIPGQRENKDIGFLQKWFILAWNASLPWTIFIWVLAVWPIYSWNELIAKLQGNYQKRAEKIIEPHSNTTYQCWEWFITQYICEDITEIVQRWNEIFDIDQIYKTSVVDDKLVTEIDGNTIQYIKKQVETFLERYPDNFLWELKVTWWLKKYDSKDPESIIKSARESEIEAILLVKELEWQIPRLKDQIKAHSKQEYLSEDQRNQFLKDLQKLWYNWWFDLNSITHFFLFTRTNFESKENQKLHSTLFQKYFWEIKLNFSWDKIVGKYTWSSLTPPLYLLILSFIVTLLYISLLLPISWRKQITKKFFKEEYWKIQNGLNSKEELEKIDRYREVLWFQSYSDAVKMFNELWSIPNWKIIRKKWVNWLVFLKNNWTSQWLRLNKEWKYNLYGSPIPNNLMLLYILEEYWFTIENIEIVDWTGLYEK